jgi:hypothetical protein
MTDEVIIASPLDKLRVCGASTRPPTVKEIFACADIFNEYYSSVGYRSKGW